MQFHGHSLQWVSMHTTVGKNIYIRYTNAGQKAEDFKFSRFHYLTILKLSFAKIFKEPNNYPIPPFPIIAVPPVVSSFYFIHKTQNRWYG